MRTFKEYLVESFPDIYQEFLANGEVEELTEAPLNLPGKKYQANLKKNVSKRRANQETAKRRSLIRKGRKAVGGTVKLGAKGAKGTAKVGWKGAKTANRALRGNRALAAGVLVGAAVVAKKKSNYGRNKQRLMGVIEKAKAKGDYNRYYAAKIKLAKITGRYGGGLRDTPGRISRQRKKVQHFQKLLQASKARKKLLTSLPK